MKKFDFCFDICLGYHCSGRGEYVTVEGSVMLEEEQVDRLVALIRANGGETDIEKLGLETKCPDVYEVLEDAYYEAVSQSTCRYWLIKGFKERYYDMPEGMMESLEEAGLFHYDPDTADLDDMDEDDLMEAKEDAFYDWLYSYVDSLNEDDQFSFIETWYGDEVAFADIGDYDFTIEIPEGIIDEI